MKRKKNQSIAKGVCNLLNNYIPANYLELPFQEQQNAIRDAISQIIEDSELVT